MLTNAQFDLYMFVLHNRIGEAAIGVYRGWSTTTSGMFPSHTAKPVLPLE